MPSSVYWILASYNRALRWASSIYAAMIASYCILVRPLIVDVYYGRLTPTINKIISGQSVHSVNDYLNIADKVAIVVFLTLPTVVVLGIWLFRSYGREFYADYRRAIVWSVIIMSIIYSAGIICIQPALKIFRLREYGALAMPQNTRVDYSCIKEICQDLPEDSEVLLVSDYGAPSGSCWMVSYYLYPRKVYYLGVRAPWQEPMCETRQDMLTWAKTHHMDEVILIQRTDLVRRSLSQII